MIIVKFQGGLGNQMFQYALYKKLLCLGKIVKADISWYNNNNAESPRELDVVRFPIHLNYSRHFERIMYRNFLAKALGKCGNMCEGLYLEKESGRYVPEILKMKYAYLDGYWQTEKYFHDIRNDLLQDFTFPDLDSQFLEGVYTQIQKTNSVSIHIRRGDYLKHLDQFGNICTEQYYLNAIAAIKEKIENPTFFVFSDDMLWAKKFLKGQKNFFFVDLEKKVNCIYDMKLMSACKHNIIANSSFSWWASWLNQNEQKVVIAPVKWQNLKTFPDIRCNNWSIIK